MKTAVLLIGFGGPETEKDIPNFLYNLFCDEYIFKIPIFQRLIAKIISKSRAKIVSKKYERIGGGSPYNRLTKKQAELLQIELSKRGGFSVFVCFRYCNPFIEDTLEKILPEDYTRVIILPLFPHYSITTTGSILNVVNNSMKTYDKANLIFINDFYKEEFYVGCVAKRISEVLEKHPHLDFQLIFTAHNIPQKIARTDTYPQQIEYTVERVMQKLNLKAPHHIAYQSKVGFGKWLQPETEFLIKDLCAKGVRNIVAIPISFVCDHYETLYQVGIEFKELAFKLGCKNFIMTESLNDMPEFIKGLADLIENSLQQRKEITKQQYEKV